MIGEGLAESWRWVAGEQIAAQSLVEYVEGEEKDISGYSLAGDKYGPHMAIVTIISSLLYTTYSAYNEQGVDRRPDPIWETRSGWLRSAKEAEQDFASNDGRLPRHAINS